MYESGYDASIIYAIKQSLQKIVSSSIDDQEILNKLAKSEALYYCLLNHGYGLSVNFLVELFVILGLEHPQSNLLHYFFCLDCLTLIHESTKDDNLLHTMLNGEMISVCFPLNNIDQDIEIKDEQRVVSGSIGYLFHQNSIKTIFLIIECKNCFELHELSLNDERISLIDCNDFGIQIQNIVFNNVALDKETMRWQEDKSFFPVHACLGRFRLLQAAFLFGYCQKQFEIAKKYCNSRQQFSKKLIDNQAVRFKLSSLFCELKLFENSLECLGIMLDHKAQDSLIFSRGVNQSIIHLLQLTAKTCMQLCGASGTMGTSALALYYRLYCILLNTSIDKNDV